jgi:hypothetical protein
MITITEIMIFVFLVKRGLAQTKGNMNGPTQRKATTSGQDLKYHLG